MGKEFIIKMEVFERYYFPKTRELEMGKSISFTGFNELSGFLAMYFTSKYCYKLIQDKPNNLKDSYNLKIWNHNVDQIESIYRAFKGAIWKMYFETKQKPPKVLTKLGFCNNCNQMYIGRKSKIYRSILKSMKEEFPKNVFPLQETYLIDLSKMTVVKVQEL